MTALQNLEDRAQDFVLGVKQIKLAEYPHAFNPSIVRWKGSLLLSFRIIPDPKHSFTAQLGVVWLDEQLEPQGKPQLLSLRNEHTHTPCRAEDGRLITIGDRLFFIYSDNEDTIISKGGFRVYLGEIHFDGTHFEIKNIQRMTSFPGNDPHRREKNWVPFIYQQQLLLAYSLSPHIIFRPLSGQHAAELFSASYNKIPWAWGELRGGTQAFKEGDHYLSFFHSGRRMATEHSHGKEMLHYFMGAYVFSAEPPFHITHISQEPIVGEKFYSGTEYKPYWAPVIVVFPGGFIRDDTHIWIVYGRQDHEMWMVKLDKNKLYEHLIPVEVYTKNATRD
jgi:predicted GH43/DUF377 family glycosyl hydrolase